MRRFSIILAIGAMALCTAGHASQPEAAAPSANAGAETEQRVELSNFDFNPKEIHLQAGHSYALVVANQASGGHNFSAREFFAASKIQAADAALVTDGEIEVPAMSTRTVHLVPAAGSYKLVCTHAGHAFLGMRGKIVVE
ncbi:MAG: cupredoxin domain-containing protein [Porphyrobacter sp.]|nr:cupredoxin domain-containing protein [Porphyrobacter sp.]